VIIVNLVTSYALSVVIIRDSPPKGLSNHLPFNQKNPMSEEAPTEVHIIHYIISLISDHMFYNLILDTGIHSDEISDWLISIMNIGNGISLAIIRISRSAKAFQTHSLLLSEYFICICQPHSMHTWEKWFSLGFETISWKYQLAGDNCKSFLRV
jgi:hypothetical protein